MQSWLGGKLISWVMRRLRGGDVRPLLLLEHPQVRMRFPGANSWSGVFRGKAEVAGWLRRFAAVGLQITPDEVAVTGPPWRATVCIRGRDHLDTPAGERVYANRFVIWGHMRWGRLRDYETYEDTHQPEVLDTYLREHQPNLIDV